MKHGIFVSGTDTGIGKTFVSALLLASLRRHGMRSGYFKPIQTGDDDDASSVASWVRLAAKTTQDRSLHPSPVYRFAAPAAPSRAAMLENQVIEIDRICAAWDELGDAAWVLEGAGGLRVPIVTRVTMRELALDLQLPLLLVASTRLGTINHTLLSLESAQSAGLRVAGIVLNGERDPGLADTIRGFTSVPILAEVPQYENLNAERFPDIAAELFSRATLDRLFSEPKRGT